MYGEYFVSYASSTIADIELNKQTDATLSKNIKFDAFFVENNKNTHYKVADVNKDEVAINLKLEVQKEGYLKNAMILLQTENEETALNYKLVSVTDEAKMIQSQDEKSIYLRQVNSNDSVELKLNVEPNFELKTAKNILNQNNKVVVKGTYIDDKGKEVPIEKEITLNLGWTGEFEVKNNVEISKYIPLNINGEKKVFVQYNIKTGLNEQKNMLPIKSTEIEMQIPEFNGINAEKINVSAKKTLATNGLDEKNVQFVKTNWKIDNSKEIVIKVNNAENEEGLINIGKEYDEYLVTLVYPEEAFNSITNTSININTNVKTKINVYSNKEEKEFEKESESKIQLTEAIGKLLSLEGSSKTDKIGKGNIYANINSTEKTNFTNYETNWGVSADYIENLDKIMLEDQGDKAVDAYGNEYDISTYSKYIKTIINKESFLKVLGVDGKIKLKDENGQTIVVIDKNTKTNENGDIQILYYGNTHKVIMETTKPISEGKLLISNEKSITGSLPYNKEQVERFVDLISTSSLWQKETDVKEFFKTEEKQIQIPFEESHTNAKLSINSETFSTLVLNKDVEFKIELGNNTSNSDLYIDPMFDIELPSYIEDVEIKNVKVLYDNELMINSVEKIKNKNAGITLRVNLSGIQTKFSSGKLTNGTNIILDADIKVGILTPSINDEIKMYYYNNNTKNYENKTLTELGYAGLYTLPVSFSAPAGLVSISNWTNFDNTGREIMSVNQGKMVEKIEAYKEAQKSKMELIIVNNTGNVCDDISILVRVPFKGNKTVLTDEELGTTIDSKMLSTISQQNPYSNNFKFYYSENGEATKDLSKSENGWQEHVDDITKIKSCLIVGNNYQMQAGETQKFYYSLDVAGNIPYNNNILSNFGTYYTELSPEANRKDASQSDIVGITTGKGPNLNITQEVSGADSEGKIKENGLLKYNIKVMNTGTESAKDVIITDQIPKWTKLVKSIVPNNTSSDMIEYYTGNGKTGQTMAEWNVVENGNEELGTTPKLQWAIPELKEGEGVEVEFEVITQDVPSIYEYYKDFPGFQIDENGKPYIATDIYNTETRSTTQKKNELTAIPDVDIKNIPTVTASNFGTNVEAEEKNVVIEDTLLVVNEKRLDAPDVGYLDDNGNILTEYSNMASEGKEIEILISIKNNTDKEKTNLLIEKTLPEGLSFVSAKFQKTILVDKETGKKYSVKEIYENAESQVDISKYDTDVEDIPADYDENNRKITGKFEKLDSGESINFVVKAKTNKLKSGEYERNISTNSKISADEVETITSNDVLITVIKPEIKATQSASNYNKYLNAGEEVTFNIEVENIGKTMAKEVKITEVLPTGLKFVSGKFNISGFEMDAHKNEAGGVTIKSEIHPGKKVILSVVAKVEDLKEDTDVTVTTEVDGQNTEYVLSEPINYLILKSENAKQENPAGSGSSSGNSSGKSTGISTRTSTVSGNRISGLAFVDSNENGRRDADESLLSNITVFAIENTSGNVAKTISGEIAKTITASDGSYEITNLASGKYILVFTYENKIYGVTKYQSANANELTNSDVIEKEVTVEGKTIIAGLTDIIDLQKSISNIDIGLVEKVKFDLKLDKTVTSAIVQNNEGKKTHTYKNTKLAEVAIGRKVQNSTVAIEYSIKITNEGNVAGYAKNIVDYKAKELTFKSEINPNWYVGNDGNIYTTSLANSLIQPGETKEIKLILTKQLNANGTGIINNRAEIKESYNEYGIKDKDSIAGNNSQGEDDQSSADVIITVRTGGKVATISAFVLIILTIIAIVIDKLRKNEKIYK